MLCLWQWVIKWNFCQNCIFLCFGNLAPVGRNIQIHHILGKSCVRLFQLNETCVKIAKLSSKIYLLLLCWPLTHPFSRQFILENFTFRYQQDIFKYKPRYILSRTLGVSETFDLFSIKRFRCDPRKQLSLLTEQGESTILNETFPFSSSFLVYLEAVYYHEKRTTN